MLSQLAEQLRNATGILHKQDIQMIAASYLSSDSASHTGHHPGKNSVRVGDDCAAIPDGGGYLLLAAEGILPRLVETDPWFAGWCAVMVNISDIAAMGGRAMAVVDTLWSQSAERAEPLWQGMQAAAHAYGIPIVGGHTNHHSPYNALSVAILGRATRLISSFQAQPGDLLLLAIDLAGQAHPQYPFWNAATTAEPMQLRQKLAILPALAEAGLCDAGKDISMGGIVGTLLMLLETSGCGAVLHLNQIPRPAEIPLERWLVSFPSYGFLLSVRPQQVAAVQAQFRQQALTCEAVGVITDSGQLWLQRHPAEERESNKTETVMFWDVRQTPLIGFQPAGFQPAETIL